MQNKTELITNEEYNALISTMQFYDSSRNNLLTFVFTTVLALLGIIIAMEDPVSPYLCLFPYFLILPFNARITYYRIASAHINSFLRSFAPEKTYFRRGTTVVREKHNCVYIPIAWLVNHEMFILSVAVGCIYVFQYITINGINSVWDIVRMLIPIPIIKFDFIITHSTNSYPKLLKHFQGQWDNYKNEITTSLSIRK